jgi:histone H3/H4
MSEDFSRAVLGQSIARVCVAFGLKETSAPCIQSLTDVVQYYIQWVGEGAVEQAEMSGRAHPGIQDALQALGNNVIKLHLY